MTSPTSPKEQEQPEEDPFADIMNKLKSQQKPKPPAEYSNLMDEEPPETFKQLNEPSEVHRKPSPLKTKPSEPSSFIKAAFSPKPKDEKEEKEKFIEPLEPSEIATEIVVKSEAVSEITTHFAELEEELKDIEYEEILKIEEPEVIVKEETNFITQDSIVEDQKLSVMETETEVITQEPTNQNVFLDLQDTEIITNEPADEKVSVELQDSEIIAQEPIVEDQMVEDRLVPVVIQEYFSTPVEPLEFLKTQVEEKNHKSPKSPIFPSFESYENSQSIGFLQQPEVISSSTSTIPFFDSLSSIMGTSDNSSTSSIKSPSSPQTKSTGFRASILKHGLSALEKIGKSTADVVVSTRNKLAEPAMTQFIPSQQPITPDYSDEISTFYDILKLYGGYAKLQVIQSFDVYL